MSREFGGPSPEEMGIKPSEEGQRLEPAPEHLFEQPDEELDLPPAPPNMFDEAAIERHKKELAEWQARQEKKKGNKE